LKLPLKDIAMKMIAAVSMLFMFSSAVAFAQDANAIDRERKYPFLIRDSPARLFTMRQFDQDYLSAYRLFSNLADDNLQPIVKYTIQIVGGLFVLQTMTHEEAHRSILVGQDIGSVSQPFLFSKRGGYVAGVADQTLKNLRDNKFPVFIRLHTAGFESDYILATREETLLSFEDESYKNLMVEYLFRKAALVRYFMEGIFKYDTDSSQEESNEFERDIVGNDLYGAIRHLHRPDMEFKRYTRYSDLTDEELRYLKRMEWRTSLNLLNGNMLGIRNFKLNNRLKVNFGMGHCMGPFGDFIDEKFWFVYRDKLKINAYLREFQNRNNWFTGGGIGVNDYPLSKRWAASLTVHYWNQPVNLDFNETAGKSGAAVDIAGSYDLLAKKSSKLESLSVDLGLIYKTAGYLPEEICLDKHFGLRFGLTLGFSK
jgi:hypothetical protein